MWGFIVARTDAFSLRQFSAFDHNYAATMHKYQGTTLDQSYVLTSHAMDNPLICVAITRQRQDVKLYASN